MFQVQKWNSEEEEEQQQQNKEIGRGLKTNEDNLTPNTHITRQTPAHQTKVHKHCIKLKNK